MKAKVYDVNVALSLEVDKSYVDGQLVLKANQATRYTKTELDDLLIPTAIKR